jgi:hypothetical protein
MVMARTVSNFDHNPAGKDLDLSYNIMIESFILYGRAIRDEVERAIGRNGPTCLRTSSPWLIPLSTIVLNRPVPP